MTTSNRSTIHMLSKIPFVEYLNFEKLSKIDSPIKFLRESKLISSIDSGFPIISPIAFIILKKLEDIIRSAAIDSGFMEISLPNLMNKNLFKRNPSFDKYSDEIIALKEPHEDLMLAATTEEMMIEYFGKSITSYKHTPMRFIHLQNVYRWIKRTEGFYSSRQIYFFGFTTFDMNLEEYKNSLILFQAICEKVISLLNIKTIKNLANDQHSIEYLWESSLGDRTFEMSAATKRDCNRSINLEDWGVGVSDRLSSLAMGYQIPFVDKFDCSFNDAQGKRCSPVMGSFGIGLQRVLIAVVEQAIQSGNFIFPSSIRPFNVCIILLGDVLKIGKPYLDEVTSVLSDAYSDILVDDRSRITLKEKLGLCDILDVSLRVLIGEKEFKSDCVEIRKKGFDGIMRIPITDLMTYIQA